MTRTTWRRKDEAYGSATDGNCNAYKAGIDRDKAIALMLAQPSMIKRPVLDLGDRRLVGFKPELYAAALR